MVPRERWLAAGGLVVLSAIATAAVFLEIAVHGSSTVVWVHHTTHAAGAGLITSVIVGAMAVTMAILRPWSYSRDHAGRAWAAIIALVVIALFGLRFLRHGGPELAPLAWWMLLVGGMCAALVVQALAGDLQTLRRLDRDAPRARLLRHRR